MARDVVRAADSRRAFTSSTASRRFSIASKRVRYPLTSRAMMSNSVNLNLGTRIACASAEVKRGGAREQAAVRVRTGRSLLAGLKAHRRTWDNRGREQR